MWNTDRMAFVSCENRCDILVGTHFIVSRNAYAARVSLRFLVSSHCSCVASRSTTFGTADLVFSLSKKASLVRRAITSTVVSAYLGNSKGRTKGRY